MQYFVESVHLAAFESLRCITEKFNLLSARVLYACSGNDKTPLSVWPKENITFLDIYKPHILLLKEAGLNAIAADAEKIEPFGEFDVIYAHNCPAKLNKCTDMLVKGGYVVGNNMYNLKDRVKDCVLIGATRKEKDPDFPENISRIFFDDETSGFFEEISSYEEFKDCELDNDLMRSFEAIIKESCLERKRVFEMMKKEYHFYKKYGELYVFQKI